MSLDSHRLMVARAAIDDALNILSLEGVDPAILVRTARSLLERYGTYERVRRIREAQDARRRAGRQRASRVAADPSHTASGFDL